MFLCLWTSRCIGRRAEPAERRVAGSGTRDHIVLVWSESVGYVVESTFSVVDHSSEQRLFLSAYEPNMEVSQMFFEGNHLCNRVESFEPMPLWAEHCRRRLLRLLVKTFDFLSHLLSGKILG